MNIKTGQTWKTDKGILVTLGSSLGGGTIWNANPNEDGVWCLNDGKAWGRNTAAMFGNLQTLISDQAESVKPSGRLYRIKAFAKRFTPHDKQQAFLFGLVIGLCAAVFLVACDNPTSPEPCTKQEIHHGDTVTVPCVIHGTVGEGVRQ